MNELIKKLAAQAGLELGTVLKDYVTPVKSITVEQRKFAELIVRECARIVTNNGIATATHDQMVRQDCVNEIKLHFGVEE